MFTLDEYIDIVIPHRMKSIDIFKTVLDLESTWDEPKKLQMYFDGKLLIDGLSTAWTNPVIESGIMHCRACLEFLGVTEDSKHQFKLKQRKGKRQDDFGIEDWDLPLLTVDQAISYYNGPSNEAEKALAAVIHCANKGIAHTTSGQIKLDDDRYLYEIAARGIPALIINHLYVPLGRPIPNYKIYKIVN